MDAFIDKLNQTVAKDVQTSKDFAPPASGGGSGQVTAFQSTLDNSMNDRMLEKMRESYGSDLPNQMTVLSAENIHVETAKLEDVKGTSAGDQFFGMFKSVNRDMISLDSTIEMLTSPGVKISPRQMLAMQAGIANTSIMAEGFSKLTDGVSKGIQNIVQTKKKLEPLWDPRKHFN